MCLQHNKRSHSLSSAPCGLSIGETHCPATLVVRGD